MELGRSGRVLGRCHAALGQHKFSAAAFDAAIELAKTGRLLMSEALGVRGRLLAAGRAAAGACEPQWSEATGRARLAEVVGRMGTEEGRAALEKALLGAE